MFALDYGWQDGWKRGGNTGTRECRARVEPLLASSAEVLKVSVAVNLMDVSQVTELATSAAAVHDVAVEFFEGLISDDFRSYIAQGSEE